MLRVVGVASRSVPPHCFAQSFARAAVNCLAGYYRELEGLNSEQMDYGMIECLLQGYN